MPGDPDLPPVSILVVCTANICRSPLGAHYLRGGLAALDLSALVASAGTHAEPGEAMCPDSAAFAGLDPAAHAANELAAIPEPAPDLILVAEREHRAFVARLAPGARASTFTLTQAAALAEHVRQTIADGFLPEGAPALPEDREARVRWLIAEMDAARGTAPTRPPEADDISDTHGMRTHKGTFAEVQGAVAAWLAAVGVIVDVPDLRPRPAAEDEESGPERG